MTEIQLNLEGYEIVRKSWLMFWNKEKGNFINSNNSDGSYSEGRYVVWPVAVYVQAIVDAARIYPQDMGPLMGPAIKAFDAYYSPEMKAYCASYNFSGNSDVYYDDNAQVASCYLSAYELTKNPEYLTKGTTNVEFLMTGLDPKIGGIKWHVSKDGVNTCSTAEVGIACARLSRLHGGDKKYTDFAAKCCDFIFNKLKKDNGLIADGLEGTEYKMNGTVWTYNQGTPLTLCGLLYFLTKDDKYLKRAEGLATAVTDRNTEIFDRDTQNLEAREYRDFIYFYHLLAEGFSDFLLFFHDVASRDVLDRVQKELEHTIRYVYNYIRDPQDGLYFQSFEIFRISQEYADRFQAFTGENKGYQPNGNEREHTKEPIEKRKLVKCLISSGGAARIFFQTARAIQKLDMC